MIKTNPSPDSASSPVSPLDSINISSLKDGLGNFRELKTSVDSISRQSEITQSKVKDLDSRFTGFLDQLTTIKENTDLLFGKPNCLQALQKDVVSCLAGVCTLQDWWRHYEYAWKNQMMLLSDRIFPRRLESCSLPPNGTVPGCPSGNGSASTRNNPYVRVPWNDSSGAGEQSGTEPLPKAYSPANWEATESNQPGSMGNGQDTTVT